MLVSALLTSADNVALSLMMLLEPTPRRGRATASHLFLPKSTDTYVNT
mgnify:CR=1 FL=1